MNTRGTHPFFPLAVDMVQRASLLAKQIQKQAMGQSLEKSDCSPVAVADFAIQALIGCLLDRALPKTPLVAEEDSSILRKPEGTETLRAVARFLGAHLAYVTPESVCLWIDKGKGEPGNAFWVLDPIDGTKGFLRGEQYAIALAYVEHSSVQFGVLGCPNLSPEGKAEVATPGAVVAAERGRGAWIAPLDSITPRQPLRVSSRQALSTARVLRSVESSHTNESKLDDFCHRAGITAEPVRLDSQAKYAVLASGHADVLLRLPSERQPDYREFIWDQAAGSIILEEAGGKVTDIHGRPLDFSQGKRLEKNIGIFASNGSLHTEGLKKLKQLYPEKQ